MITSYQPGSTEEENAIESLKQAAWNAGDYSLCDLCDMALEGEEDALARVREVLADGGE